MDEIIFHSLFGDQSFNSLKHFIFYFDQVTIPSNSYAVNFGPRHDHPHFFQLIPDEIRDHLGFLINEGVIKLKEFKGKENGNPDFYWDSIVEGINKKGKEETYSRDDISDICRFVGYKPDLPDYLTVAQEASIFIAAICLMEFSIYSSTCCLDNHIVYDNFMHGIKGIINSTINDGNLKTIELRKIKSNMLAQKLISLNLPSFEFYSFDDVLELKRTFKDALQALNSYLFDLSDKIELSPYEPGFDQAVSDFILKRLNPEIEALKKEIISSPVKLASKIYSPIKNMTISILFSSAYPDLTQKLLFGGVSLSAVEVLLKEFQTKNKKLKESPLGIFLSFD